MKLWKTFFISRNYHLLFSFIFYSFIFSNILFLNRQDIRFQKGSVFLESLEGNQIKISSTPNGQYNRWTSLSEFPHEWIEIIINTEDKYFYYHPGFNPFSILRAIQQNFHYKKHISGASTITQQLIRILYAQKLPSNKYSRKVLEILLAMNLELRYSKSEILESYINLAPVKYNLSGFSLASIKLFNKDIRLLTREEFITLIVFLRGQNPNPENFYKRFENIWRNNFPKENPEYTLEIQNLLITQAEYKLHQKNSISHFGDWFSGNTRIKKSGRYRSTISENLNEKVNSILKNEFRYLEKHGAKQTSALVLKMPGEDRNFLDIISFVGSLDYEAPVDGQVNGIVHVREAGSTLKPFIFAKGFDNHLFLPNSILEDRELSIKKPWQRGSFSPRNYDLNYWGNLTITEALANSRNIPAVTALEMISTKEFLSLLRDMDFDHLSEDFTFYGPGLSLGSGGASLLQLTRAYSSFANDGILYPVRLGIDSENKDIVFGSKKYIFTKRTSDYIKYILSNKDIRRRSFGKRNFLDFPFDVAAKTGTSKDYKDAWTIGFTNDYVVGVWVGNFQGKKMNSISGAWGAGRSFHQIIRLLTGKDKPRFQYSPDLEHISICRKTGQKAERNCPKYTELLPKNTKIEICKIKHDANLNPSLKPEIVYPSSGESFILDPFSPLENQKVPIKILLKETNNHKFFYQINNSDKIQIQNDLQTSISLNPGEYRIHLFMDDEIISSTNFSVQ